MDDKKARELLIKAGLSENKAGEISGHLAREFNKDQEHYKKKKEIDINEVVTNDIKHKTVHEVITK